MFPLWYLLVPYGIFLGLATLFVFFNLFHIARYGLQSAKTTFIFIVYLFSFVAIIWISFSLLQNVPWRETVDLREIIKVPSFSAPDSSDDDL